MNNWFFLTIELKGYILNMRLKDYDVKIRKKLGNLKFKSAIKCTKSPEKFQVDKQRYEKCLMSRKTLTLARFVFAVQKQRIVQKFLQLGMYTRFYTPTIYSLASSKKIQNHKKIYNLTDMEKNFTFSYAYTYF